MYYLKEQVDSAKYNYNYFFIKLVFSILKSLMKLAVILLISGILNYTIIYIISLILTIYILHQIFNLCTYYFNIIKDIATIFGYSDISFEIDLTLFKGNIFKGVMKYGE